VAHNQSEMANVEQNLARHNAGIEEMAQHIAEAKAQQAQATALINSSLAERQAAAEACANIQTSRTEISAQVQEGESALSKLRSEANRIQEEIQNERIRETNIKNRHDSLTQKLQDQYEMTLDAAKAQFTTPVSADAETLEKLKKRVANMGPINLAAPQEYEELVEKNTFLTTQQTDLVKAREDLKQVITKINSTTREHFRETFNKVRENFRALYGTLFQGGEADLRFTDETDILNTGVDIYCQPPGKKLLHISLLSGGEKALTAIALLFAFFQVRPSPVALLDEVDAPLDEANVLRYAEMIKKFSENSQFLLISHNKRTMEVANTLYGVTMEELGVSKVLSARLHKKEAAEVAAVSA
jgi:chromosome segregation protein